MQSSFYSRGHDDENKAYRCGSNSSGTWVRCFHIHVDITSTICCKLGYPAIDNVTKWKHFPRYWPFVWEIHQWAVDSPLKGQWSGALVFSFIYASTNSWANNQDTDNLRHHYAHYDITGMKNSSQNSNFSKLISSITLSSVSHSLWNVAYGMTVIR